MNYLLWSCIGIIYTVGVFVNMLYIVCDIIIKWRTVSLNWCWGDMFLWALTSWAGLIRVGLEALQECWEETPND